MSCAAGASSAASSCAAISAASAACASSAATSAASIAAMSAAHRSSVYSYNDEEDGYYGNIRVGLKDVKTQVKEAKGFWNKFLIGDEEWQEEAITHIDYLQRIYKVFENLGYTNILFLDMNSETVYKDKKRTPNDFEKAIKLALKKEIKERYRIAMGLDINGDGKTNVIITMVSKHDVGVYPLIIEVFFKNKPQHILRKIASEIDKQFRVTKIKINKDE